MNNNILQAEFIDSPDTVDFIIRQSEAFNNLIRDHPNVFLPTQVLSGRYVIGYINHEEIDSVMENLGTSFVSALPIILGLLDYANLDAAGIIQVQQQPYLNLRGQGVLIGFVDTGIDYTKSAFIYEDGTSKIQYIYDQSERSGTTPEGFFIGTEYTNKDINEALRSENPYEIVPQKDTVGHGTFLASLAASRESGEYIGAAPDAEMIVVKLKNARPYYRELYLVPPEQQNAYESTAVMIGIEYILKKAKELNRPVAICIGVGSNTGSHDGFSLFEEYLSNAANLAGHCICTAAGNESQARHHTQGVITATGGTNTIEIKVGENAGNILVNIWNLASDRFSVSITSPTGEVVGRVPARSGTILRTRLILERATVVVEYYFPVEGGGGQVSVVKILNATPGVWTITVYGDIILDGTYHAWLPLTGFVSPVVEFLAPNPNFTIVVPATSTNVITCGAYNSNSNSLFAKTSWGPTRLPAVSPDLVGPGVNVGGIYPNGYGTMDGTSAANAILTGAGALMLQWGIVQGNDPGLSTYQIRSYLIRGCTRDPNTQYPNNQWGYGKLNLIQSFNLMRER